MNRENFNIHVYYIEPHEKSIGIKRVNIMFPNCWDARRHSLRNISLCYKYLSFPHLIIILAGIVLWSVIIGIPLDIWKELLSMFPRFLPQISALIRHMVLEVLSLNSCQVGNIEHCDGTILTNLIIHDVPMPPSKFRSTRRTVLDELSFEHSKMASTTVIWLSMMPQGLPASFSSTRYTVLDEMSFKHFRMASTAVIWLSMMPQGLPASFSSTWHSVLDEMSFEHFKMASTASSDYPWCPKAFQQVSVQPDIRFLTRCRLNISRWLPQRHLIIHDAPRPSSKFQFNLTFGSWRDVVWTFQDGFHSVIWLSMMPQGLPASFSSQSGHLGYLKTISALNLHDYYKIHDGWYDGHLGYSNGAILALLNLYVAKMPTTKCWSNLTYGLGGDGCHSSQLDIGTQLY